MLLLYHSSAHTISLQNLKFILETTEIEHESSLIARPIKDSQTILQTVNFRFCVDVGVFWYFSFSVLLIKC